MVEIVAARRSVWMAIREAWLEKAQPGILPKSALGKATAKTADAKTTEFVIYLLQEHEPYEKISRLASTPLENVRRIAKMNNLVYN